MNYRNLLTASLVLTILIGCASAETWKLTNITKQDYKQEPLRLGFTAPDGKFHITKDGQPIPFAVIPDMWTGEKQVWVVTDLASSASATFASVPGEGEAIDQTNGPVKLSRKGNTIILENGKVAVRLGGSGNAPAPIAAVKLGDQWVGEGGWDTSLKPIDCKITVLAEGNPFARVRLHYTFDGKAGLKGDLDAFATIDVTLYPGSPAVVIDEHHAMPRGSAWTFDATANWSPSEAYLQPHHIGPSGQGPKRFGKQPLKQGSIPNQPKELLLNLFPRWNQHYKDGWFAAAVNDDHLVGALVVRASLWYWMHDNAIEALVPEDGQMTLRCPTWKGTRHWLLLAGQASLAGQEKDLANSLGFEALNTIAHAIPVQDWPGAKGNFKGYFPFTGNINPTGFWRQMGKNAVRNAGKTNDSLSQLTYNQWLMHPDVYGSYWLFHSPENPNFFTDFIKVPIGEMAQLRNHPQFPKLAKMVEQKFHEDLYHSVTLPGGAGQECPGYLSHAIHAWEQMAPMCKQYFGFDPRDWPRFQAAKSFLLHTSQPVAPGQRWAHPGGDTHPTGPKITGSVKGFKTEELPGFGIVFRNNAGNADETYLAFKSGPNRGHYHGDQLSFHYCAHARQVAIDHMCSYAPRAGQEHMHNRVSFSTKDMPYANMDGYERVIAFKPGDKVDIAMGQVESPRMRKMTKLPPEEWHAEYPQRKFGELLKYRRTIVQIKNEAGEDYFVIRDQYDAPEDVAATYNLHVLTKDRKRQGNTIEFGNLNVFVAAPAEYDYDTLDWSFTQRGHSESTLGIRLTDTKHTGQFITVLHPGKLPETESIENGVKVGDVAVTFAGNIDDSDDTTYVTVKKGDATIAQLTGKDIEMERSQGEIGLFVPDAGYPFGPIPDWLARQRLKVPDWAPDWAKDIRNRKQ